MKKVVLIIFSFILVLMLAVGCNPGSGSAGGAKGWPADDLPPGFPVYPNGEVTDVGGKMDNGGGILIEVSYTDKAAYNQYQKTLTADGWIEANDGIRLMKGSLLLGLVYYDAGDDTGVIHLLLEDLDAVLE